MKKNNKIQRSIIGTLIILLTFTYFKSEAAAEESLQNAQIETTIQIYNFQNSGSTTISNIIVLSGEQKPPPQLPFLLKTNGDGFKTTLSSSTTISSTVVIEIQNIGKYSIQAYNSKTLKSISLANNKLTSEGELTIQGELSFKLDDVTWNIKSVALGGRHSVAVLIGNIK